MTTPSEESIDLDRRTVRRGELRNVIAMAVPVVITTSSRALMDVADYVMITNLDSTDAQAAMLPAQMIMWCYIVLGLGIVSLVNTFASQSMGRKQWHDCSAFAWQGIYVAAIVGVIGVAARPLLPGIIDLFEHEESVRILELAYAKVSMFTVGPTLSAAALGWFFIGIHRPWVTMWSVIEANVVNVVVSLVLIFGWLGFEPMGIAGAAWGTLAGVVYRTLRLLLTMTTPAMDRQYGARQTWRPNWSKMKDLLRTGLPCGLHWISEVLAWTLFVSVLIGHKFGTAHLVATNTVWQFLRLSFMPSAGVGNALTALVGKSIGAGDPDRAIRETRIAAVITLVYMGGIGLIYAVFRRELIMLFNTDPEVVDIGASIMICAAVFQLFDALGITYVSALRGAGDTFIPSMMFIVGSWVIILGGGWTATRLFPQLQSLGPWIAASSFIVVTGVLLWYRWHSRKWMRIDLFRKDQGGRAEEAS
ncbi:MAG: MATE family efflux transporter [Planctomycetes bacterium]|nr:MATE family efflux transporter [Planctomycetota bacterium]